MNPPGVLDMIPSNKCQVKAPIKTQAFNLLPASEALRLSEILISKKAIFPQPLDLVIAVRPMWLGIVGVDPLQFHADRPLAFLGARHKGVASGLIWQSFIDAQSNKDVN